MLARKINIEHLDMGMMGKFVVNLHTEAKLMQLKRNQEDVEAKASNYWIKVRHQLHSESNGAFYDRPWNVFSCFYCR